MAQYVVIDSKSRKFLILFVAVAVLLFVAGILIGYFSGKNASSNNENIDGNNEPVSVADAIRASCSADQVDPDDNGDTYFQRYLERHDEHNACVNSADQCWDFGLPRHYIAYHLNGKSINIDGKLDDEAWNEIPWTEMFTDMRSDVFPKPYEDTKVKVRWDDSRLYIGAYMQEEHLWGQLTDRDSRVFQENGFQVTLDVDGSMFNYKQIQINALGTLSDKLLYKSPHDSDNIDDAKVLEWNADMLSNVYADGTVNKSTDIDKFWSVEMAIAFHSLANGSDRVQDTPANSEVWFMQFGRAERELVPQNDGSYKTKAKTPSHLWAWNPTGASNWQLQDRWGLVQFKRSLNDKEFRFEKWHVYKALFDTMNAMKTHTALNSKSVDSLAELDIPPYLMSKICVELPVIALNVTSGGGGGGSGQGDTSSGQGVANGFNVTVRSKLFDHKPAHIRDDRYVWFE